MSKAFLSIRDIMEGVQSTQLDHARQLFFYLNKKLNVIKVGIHTLTISQLLAIGFWIPMAQNDRTLPLFDFCCSNLKTSDWLKRNADFSR